MSALNPCDPPGVDCGARSRAGLCCSAGKAGQARPEDCEVTIETHRTPPLCRFLFLFCDCCFLHEFTIRI
jgi:hypothetical protein